MFTFTSTSTALITKHFILISTLFLGWYDIMTLNNVESTSRRCCARQRWRCCATLFQRYFNVVHQRCINVVQPWKCNVGFGFVFNGELTNFIQSVQTMLIRNVKTTLIRRWKIGWVLTSFDNNIQGRTSECAVENVFIGVSWYLSSHKLTDTIWTHDSEKNHCIIGLARAIAKAMKFITLSTAKCMVFHRDSS